MFESIMKFFNKLTKKEKSQIQVIPKIIEAEV